MSIDRASFRFFVYLSFYFNYFELQFAMDAERFNGESRTRSTRNSCGCPVKEEFLYLDTTCYSYQTLPVFPMRGMFPGIENLVREAVAASGEKSQDKGTELATRITI